MRIDPRPLDREPAAREILLEYPGVDANVSLIEVSEDHFEATDADALAVLADGRPLGLVTRQALTTTLSARFGHALFGRSPIASVADRDALILDESASLELCLRLAFERSERRAYDDLIIVDSAGFYRGMVSVKGLVIYQTDRLAHERAKKAEALARTRQLEEVATMKSRFLAAITHELRAPINTILGIGELLDRYHASGRVDRLGPHLNTLRSTTAHLRALVDNVLDQAKLEAGKMSVVVERFDARSLVEELVAGVKVLAQADVEVRCELPDRPVEITSDPVKVRQILTNLASNAAKFTEAGEIVLSINPLVDAVELTVADTGPGIAEAHLPMLFLPFTQLSKVETRKHGGTGLGLSLSKQLAELLGGTIDVETRVGQGTRMTLRLPRDGA
jgi:signal transduction histidine kinase